MNFELNKFDMVVVDEASLLSPETFHLMASTFNRLNISIWDKDDDDDNDDDDSGCSHAKAPLPENRR